MTTTKDALPELRDLAASLAWSNIPDQRAQILAEAFHATYECLAPDFGYETRPETKRFEAFSANGRLMIAVCGEILAALASKQAPTDEQAVSDWNIKNGLLALKQVVSELRDCSQFIDEEGEFTNALAGLGAALASRPAEAQAKSEPAALTDAQLDALMPGAAYCVDAGSGGSIPGYSTAQVRASMRAAIKLTKQDQEAANRYWWMNRRSRWVSVRADFDRNSTYVRHRVCWYANDGWHEAEGQSFEEAVDAAIAATQEQKP